MLILLSFVFYTLYRASRNFRGIYKLIKDLILTLFVFTIVLGITQAFWAIQWLQTFQYITTPLSMETYGMLGAFSNLAFVIAMLTVLLVALKLINNFKIEESFSKGFKLIAMDEKVFQNLRNRLSKMFNPKSASTIMYALGKEEGLQFIKESFKGNLKAQLNDLSKLINIFGFGKIQLSSVENDKFEALLYSSIEANGTKSKEPICYFIQGFLAGLFEKLTGLQASVTENKCIAKGDAYCRFSIKLSKIEGLSMNKGV